MKQWKLIVSIIFLTISCSTFSPRYLSKSSNNIEYYLDSIGNADLLTIPNLDTWNKSYYISNDDLKIENSMIVIEKYKRFHIFSVTKVDSIYKLNYRVE